MKPITLQEPVNIKSEAISIAVSIGRGIFQKYFPPSVFKKFDSDYKLTQLIVELFENEPEAVKLLSQKWSELERKINKKNVLAVLQNKARVDFEWFIEGELWRESSAFQVFQVFLERIETYENEQKVAIFEAIESEEVISEDDYMFILELCAYERCGFSEFQKLYKFIRNTQYEGHLIIASLWSMKNRKYKMWFAKLVKDQWSVSEKEVLAWFL